MELILLEKCYFGMLPLATVLDKTEAVLDLTPDDVDYDLELAENDGTYNGFHLQRRIVDATVKNHLPQPPASYRNKFLKQFIVQIEARKWEVCEELWCAASAACQESRNTFDSQFVELGWKTFFLPDNQTVSISHQPFLIAEGTTGLNTWDAAFFMVEFLCQHPEIARNKRVLELGCGSGLTGMCVTKLLSPCHYTFSDHHKDVLANLQRNVLRNDISSSLAECVNFDWDTATERGLCDIDPEVIIACDIAFSEELIVAFVHLLSMTLSLPDPPAIYVATKKRNPRTTAFFIETAEKSGFCVRPQHLAEMHAIFHKSSYAPTDCEIYRLARSVL